MPPRGPHAGESEGVYAKDARTERVRTEGADTTKYRVRPLRGSDFKTDTITLGRANIVFKKEPMTAITEHRGHFVTVLERREDELRPWVTITPSGNQGIERIASVVGLGGGLGWLAVLAACSCQLRRRTVRLAIARELIDALSIYAGNVIPPDVRVAH